MWVSFVQLFPTHALSLEFVLGFCHKIAKGEIVRLNLINHFVGIIPCQFAYNLALRNPVFRWESCKGSVCESVKKCSRLWTEAVTCNWISGVARNWQAARRCTRMKHAKKLNHHASYSTTEQKVQFDHSITSRLELAAQLSREAKPPASSVLKNWLFAFHSHPSIYTPYTHEM